ncbi:MAG: glycoside hydrolase family 88 protein [Ignavibacteriae bacterium]|nr:MAG: glycoside hydrolase family 88 protein [Ignavibacteriota bacterium]
MKISGKILCVVLLAIIFPGVLNAQTQNRPVNDVTTPLYLLQPEYPTPYGAPAIDSIKAVLNKVYNYLHQVTPAKVIDKNTKQEITDFSKLNKDAAFAKADFRLISYEWGVAYAGMMLASQVTGEKHYAEYATKRLLFIAELAEFYRNHPEMDAERSSIVHSVLHPGALDDAGAMCAAMIKASQAGNEVEAKALRPVIDNFIDFIRNKQYRLPDGTLARNRPHPNTLWTDDLFMSVPALAQMGKLTGDNTYYDDAVKQVLQYSQRMFNEQKGLYIHGWVQGMSVHPEYFWGRANGWVVLAMVELLDVLPKTHPGYQGVLKKLQAHVKGLAQVQDGTGFWHQLLDRSDTYLETSATTIYTYSIARAINNGFIDPMAYVPVAILGWNAVATKVNSKGQIEGTCVGTGMGFDPAFYYHRPVNVFAAHGYGPVMLAGSEIIKLMQNYPMGINESSLQLKTGK